MLSWHGKRGKHLAMLIFGSTGDRQAAGKDAILLERRDAQKDPVVKSTRALVFAQVSGIRVAGKTVLIGAGIAYKKAGTQLALHYGDNDDREFRSLFTLALHTISLTPMHGWRSLR